MALTGIDYLFWRELRDEGLLPSDPSVLELGQANWYGDRDPACLVEDVYRYAKESDVPRLLSRLSDPGSPQEPVAFIQADVFYKAILQFREINAIDMHGTPRAHKRDLNNPLIESRFDLIINSGTAEHIFNQNQFFNTCHDACMFNGLMVHTLPAWGWLDHGFYNYHPTFIADLAAANGYDVVKWWLYDLAYPEFTVIREPKRVHTYAKDMGLGGSVLYTVCYRKTTDDPFRMPMQGHYAGTLDRDAEEAWYKMR